MSDLIKTKNPLIFIPKNIEDFMLEDSRFDGGISLEDLDVCTVCLDVDSRDLIAFEATIIDDESDSILEWCSTKNWTKLWLNGELIFEDITIYNLTFECLAI